MFGKGLQLRLRLLRTHAGLQPPHDRSSERIVLVDANSQRHPQFVIQEIKDLVWWQDAYDRVWLFVECDAGTDDVRISSETALPQTLR